MTQELSKTFETAIAGYQASAAKPVSQAEASALRDRMKSLIDMITRQAEGLAKAQAEIQTLRARADDADETSRQLRALAMRVSDLEHKLKKAKK